MDEAMGIGPELSRWRSTVLDEELARTPEQQAHFRTGSGLTEVETVYVPSDTQDQAQDYLERIGLPGQFPFTRGRRPAGHRNFAWRLGYYAGFGDAADTNVRLKKLVESGAEYVTLAWDLPSQCGYDPDHALAWDDVGKVGVSMACADDIEAVLQGIDLRQVGTGTVGNCVSPIAVGLFTHAARSQGLAGNDIRVSLQNDPLKEFTGRGTQIVPLEPSVELAADVVEYCIKERARWVPQYACTPQLRWGGVTAAEEIAFGIANYACYLDALVRRRVDISVAAPRLEGLHMTADNDLFEEVAKFRATRRLWAAYARERYGTDDPAVLGVKITVFTGAHRLTSQEPLNNITRTTVHVLAALLGGAERMSTPAYDEALALPTEESTRIANLTKMVLLLENNVGHTVDPLGGSYFVESLTDSLEEKAREILAKVDAAGGAVGAIESGIYETAMVTGSYAEAVQADEGERIIIGVNAFTQDHQIRPELFRTKDEYRSSRIETIKRIREERDHGSVDRCARELRHALAEKKTAPRRNTVPEFIACVDARMTTGEMATIMRETFGEA
jgi:methylmalonyl-CoA mutase N-terminal domain/subunit